MNKKPRSDSELQAQIPEAQQRAIIELLRSNSYKKVVDLVKAEPFNLETSVGSLQRFWQWWFAQRQIEQWAEGAKSFEATLKQMRELQKVDLDDRQISELGQAHFTLQSIREEDPKLFFTARGKRQTDRQLDLYEREVRVKEEAFQVRTCELFLKWFKDEAARSIAEGSATNAEKITALREQYFKDVDALEKSGEVVMPQ